MIDAIKWCAVICMTVVFAGCQEDSSEEYKTERQVYSCEEFVVITDGDASGLEVLIYNDKELLAARQMVTMGGEIRADDMTANFSRDTLWLQFGDKLIGPCLPDPAEAVRRSNVDTCFYISDYGSLIRTFNIGTDSIFVEMKAGSYPMLDTVLPQVQSGSGAKYERGDIVFWTKGNTAMLIYKGVMYGHCVRMWRDEIDNACNDTTAIGYLRKALKEELSSLPMGDRKFASEWIDLNGDGEDELFAMLLSPYYCGSGGCTWYIFNPDGSVLTRGTVAGFPVYLSENTSNGYKTFYMRSAGQFHIMEYDGNSYPTNPSVQQVTPLFNDPNFTRANTPRLLETAGFKSCQF